MAKQLKNGKRKEDLDGKIDMLREVADYLLDEIRSLKFGREVELKEGINFYEEINNYQIQLIESALEIANGNQKNAARLLNLKQTTLSMKMKNLNMKRS